MGVVHHHQRRLIAAHAFQPARHGAQLRTGRDCGGQVHAQGAHAGNHAQQVRHVVAANHLALQNQYLIALDHVKAQAGLK